MLNYSRQFKMWSAFCALAIFASGSAYAASADECAYNEAKSLVSIITKTVGLKNSKQLDAIKKFSAMTCQLDAADPVLEAGLQRAIGELPDRVEIQKQLDPKQRVVAQLLQAVRESFNDPTLELPENIQSNVIANADGTAGLAGQIDLKNGAHCSVESSVQATCRTRMDCTLGSSWKRDQRTTDCN